MTVDKISSDIAANPALQEKIDKVRKNRQEKATRAENLEAAQSADNASLSDEARKLQETERILRFALERLEQFDEVRQEKLEGVADRLDSDFYFSEEVNGEVSERIFSDEEVKAQVERNQQMRQFLGDVHQIDEQMQAEDVDTAKLDTIRQRIANGFYDSEEVLASVADRLMELTE